MSAKVTKEDSPVGRRERTRARLIAAADQLIAENGYEALVLEEVAERAGVTRRTIYDHFRDKGELIVAVSYHHGPTRFAVPVKPGQTLRSYLRAVANAVIEMSETPRLGQPTAHLYLYVLSHDDVRAQVAAMNRDVHAKVAAALVSAFGRGAFGMSPTKFVHVLRALADGLLMRRYMMAELFTKDVVYAAFDALATSAEQKR